MQAGAIHGDRGIYPTHTSRFDTLIPRMHFLVAKTDCSEFIYFNHFGCMCVYLSG